MGIGGRPGYRRATVVGGGVIGISWTALFLAHGLEVTVCDPLPDVAERVRAGLREIAPTLAQLGLPVDDLTDSSDALRFDPEAASAVAGADVVQENGPERPEVKQQLWSAIEGGAPANALLASSSSGIPASVMSQAMRQPGRLVVGHPFNPPHLVPAAQPPQDQPGLSHAQAVPVLLPTPDRLDEVPAIGSQAAQVIIAEIGLDMGQFPTPAHLVSWAKLSPRTIQSGAKHRAGTTGKGNPYLKGVLGEAAAAAAKTNTFLGERYRRLVKRRGKRKALVAVARSILVIVWHLLADPAARCHDLGAGYYADRIDKGKKARNHIRQLQALGFTVTLAPAA